MSRIMLFYRFCQAPYGQQAILAKYENLIAKERMKDVGAGGLHIGVYR